MNHVNTFFWSRRKPSMELVRSVDELLDQLFPPEKRDALGYSLDALSVINNDQSTLPVETSGHDDGKDADEAEDSGDDQSGDDEACAKTVPEELERQWAKIRSVFHGWDDEQVDREKKMDHMAELLLRFRVLEKALIPKVLGLLTFETRKYVGHVFRAMTVHNLRGFIEFIGDRPEILRWLVEGYKNNDTALICGAMLRDCFEHQTLAVLFLGDMETEFELLFKVARTNSNFDISADALMNISRLLLSHKEITAQILDNSFDRIFGLLNGLLTIDNYATKRQSLQLLAEVLLNPVNFAVMQRYVASRNNLKLVMLLLREPSQALRMDAFHVFKIFVANPNKSTEVEQLLLRNREKLLAFVSDFGKQETNRDFHQEKSLLVFTLQRMAEKKKRPASGNTVPGKPTAAASRSTNTVTLEKSAPEVCAHQD